MSHPLPGLELLLATLRKHRIATDLHPPAAQPLGPRVDPILAEVYSRFDGGRLGDLGIVASTVLVSFNEELGEGVEPRVQKLFRFGRIAGLADYFATVPSLTGPDGAQPVVYLLSYIDKTILPFASNVDRAFALYARYCDEQISLCGSLWDEPPFDRDAILFPDSFVKQVAQDEPLVRLLADGRFDDLVIPDEASRAWVQSVLATARALH